MRISGKTLFFTVVVICDEAWENMEITRYVRFPVRQIAKIPLEIVDWMQDDLVL